MACMCACLYRLESVIKVPTYRESRQILSKEKNVSDIYSAKCLFRCRRRRQHIREGPQRFMFCHLSAYFPVCVPSCDYIYYFCASACDDRERDSTVDAIALKRTHAKREMRNKKKSQLKKEHFTNLRERKQKRRK